jgi:hypothetical protein
MDSILRASLWLSKVRTRGATEFVAPVRRREHTLSMFATTPPHPGDFVTALDAGYSECSRTRINEILSEYINDAGCAGSFG